jgi:hypothetical protein
MAAEAMDKTKVGKSIVLIALSYVKVAKLSQADRSSNASLRSATAGCGKNEKRGVPSEAMGDTRKRGSKARFQWARGIFLPITLSF